MKDRGPSFGVGRCSRKRDGTGTLHVYFLVYPVAATSEGLVDARMVASRPCDIWVRVFGRLSRPVFEITPAASLVSLGKGP
jgi:hypothetical protein